MEADLTSNTEELPEGGALIVDKEKGWTSFDVVNKLRHVLHVKKAGHTGTLDPNATGVLVVLFGKATKCAEKLSKGAVKKYEAGMIFGKVTDTQDITGEVLSEREFSVTEEQLVQALQKFTGKLSQLPPMYSAKKINGKKLYEYAREGKEIERKPSDVEIFENRLISFDGSTARISVTCSAGTYIRTLINDIGEYLSCGACMGDLRRTAAGDFTIESALTVERITKLINEKQLLSHIIPLNDLQ